MDTRRISELIIKAYGQRYNLVPRYEPEPSVWARVEQRLRAIWPATRDSRTRLLIATAMVLILGFSIYYYNIILAAEHEMLKSGAQVEVLLQRRNDLSVNLAKAVQDYSSYERQVLVEIVRLRGVLSPEDFKANRLGDLARVDRKALSALQPSATSTSVVPDVSISPDATASLAGLLAIAEQYPDLKLSANFQSLMAALVEVERDLAGERFKFNNAVMVYWKYVASIPSNIFASCFGFKNPTYFKATEEACTLKPIIY